MIKRKMTSNYSGWNWVRKVEQDIQEYEKLTGRKLDTPEKVITHLFGAYNERPSTCLDIYLFIPSDKIVLHRFNLLWVFTLTLFCAPYRYLRYGEIGWTNKTRVGKFILECIGEDK